MHRDRPRHRTHMDGRRPGASLGRLIERRRMAAEGQIKPNYGAWAGRMAGVDGRQVGGGGSLRAVSPCLHRESLQDCTIEYAPSQRGWDLGRDYCHIPPSSVGSIDLHAAQGARYERAEAVVEPAIEPSAAVQILDPAAAQPTATLRSAIRASECAPFDATACPWPLVESFPPWRRWLVAGSASC
jgi:hypothetical protein